MRAFLLPHPFAVRLRSDAFLQGSHGAALILGNVDEY
jgi:hypothetical protein